VTQILGRAVLEFEDYHMSRKVENHSLNDTASYLRRSESSCYLFLVHPVGFAVSRKGSILSITAAGDAFHNSCDS
jgi:hypothetical protein